MIVTHTRTKKGDCRVYLGGRSSLECWIEPDVDGRAWRFRMEPAVTGNRLTLADQRATAVDLLSRLAEMVGVAPEHLAAVPYEAIAALHTVDPYACRRIPAPRNRYCDSGYMATPPGITRPTPDFVAPERQHARARTR
jgi:hypothetical protein